MPSKRLITNIPSKVKLNTKLVNRLPPKDKQYKVWDTEIKGYFVRVSPLGRVTFALNYRHEGLGRDYTIGPLGKFTADTARSEAIRLSAALTNKIDIQLDKKNQRQKAKQQQLTKLGNYIEQEYKSYVESHLRSHHEQLRVLTVDFGFFHEQRMEAISKSKVNRWVNKKLKSGLKPSTINRRIAILKAVLSHAKEHEFIHESPLKGMKQLKDDPHKRVRFLSDNEEVALRNALAERQNTQRAKRSRANQWRQARPKELLPDLAGVYTDYLMPMVILALNTGMRRGELFKLQWKHINFDTRILTVTGDISKVARTRQIPLNLEASKTLKAWHRITNQSGLVFPSPVSGKVLNNIYTAWKGLITHAKIMDFRFHDIRHHFASMLVMNGSDLYAVKELLGHKDIDTTMIYAHLSPEHKSRAVDVLNHRYQTMLSLSPL